MSKIKANILLSPITVTLLGTIKTSGKTAMSELSAKGKSQCKII